MAKFTGEAESLDFKDENVTESPAVTVTSVQFILQRQDVGAGYVVFIRTTRRPPVFNGRTVEIEGELTQDGSLIQASHVYIPSLTYHIYGIGQPGLLAKVVSGILLVVIAFVLLKMFVF